MTINKENNDEKEEFDHHRNKYQMTRNIWPSSSRLAIDEKKMMTITQGKLQIINKKSPSPKSTIDEKKEMTITKANNKSKEGNDHHYGQ